MAGTSNWDHNRQEESLEHGLRIAAIQKKLGLRINIGTTLLMHRICNGDPETAHVTNERFFDDSFFKSVKMGCPFAPQHRYGEIRDRIDIRKHLQGKRS